MNDDSSEAEFDVEAAWTVEAVAALGSGHAVPAGCRGSGGPDALDWLGRHLGLGPYDHLLDVGAGLGGPAAFARERFGVRATLVEPMRNACAAAGTLFGLPAIQATVESLPVPDERFDRVWCIGVLCTLDDLETAVGALAQVTQVGGLVGLLVYIRTVPVVEGEPATNHFPATDELDRHLARAGLAVLHTTALEQLGAPPDEWDRRADEVDRWIEDAHGSEDVWKEAHASEDRVAELLEEGTVAGRLLVARRER
jgi:SAM-dependent methyltransferase